MAEVVLEFDEFPPPLPVLLKSWQIVIKQLLAEGGKNLTVPRCEWPTKNDEGRYVAIVRAE